MAGVGQPLRPKYFLLEDIEQPFSLISCVPDLLNLIPRTALEDSPVLPPGRLSACPFRSKTRSGATAQPGSRPSWCLCRYQWREKKEFFMNLIKCLHSMEVIVMFIKSLLSRMKKQTGHKELSPVSERKVYADADVGVDFDRVQRLRALGLTEYNGWMAPDRVVEFARNSEFSPFDPMLVGDVEYPVIDVMLSYASMAWDITYRNYNRHESQRRIWPIEYYHRRENRQDWRCYCDAFDSATGEIRTFDVAKIIFLQPAGDIPQPPAIRQQRSFNHIREVQPVEIPF